MAMTLCRECTRDVSTEAASCPHCGVPNPSYRDASKFHSSPPEWQPGDPYPARLQPRPNVRGGLFGKRIGGLRVGNSVNVSNPLAHGRATILDISTDPSRGYATKLFPSFLVEFADGTRGWFNRIDLEKEYSAD
ncbi:hypothetical protein SAMN05660748_4215 [Blastococcus aggregatus]|uniref:Uncharacterized protein n=1 Tax=Blastococcus aggregatus TaxID=38502 RepID=A0A285VH25_9ACTN|nr:hypothetical protein [Blastococcus aggregatus]SOC52868.1 hypothetical protein SAMN05660748_4215 [Blastococcus aggregatus]